MNVNTKTKLIGTIVGIVLFIALIAGISYAWWIWNSSNVGISGNTECFAVNYSMGKTLTNESAILFDENTIINNDKITIKKGMAITGVTFSMDESCYMPADIDIVLNVTDLNPAYISGDSVGAFKYALTSYDPSLYSDMTVQTLSGETFDIIKSESITSIGEIHLMNDEITIEDKGYLLIFYVDGDLAMNDASNTKFTATITGIANQKKEVNAIEHITNLYVKNYDPSKNVTFADGTGMNYYAPSVRLMNDGLDITGSMVEEEAAVNGTAGNVRYYGPDNVNLKNHIYFNCTDYSNQSSETCETWRIIGIVDGKVKIIKEGSIGYHPYDDFMTMDASDNYWHGSTLSFILELYYKSAKDYECDGCFDDPIDFTSSGINEVTRNKNLISDSTWYVNGLSEDQIYPNAAYKGERTGGETWTGYIGLAYPSDYGYTVDLNSFKQTLDSYYITDSGFANSKEDVSWWFSANFSNTALGDDTAGFWFITPRRPGTMYSWYALFDELADRDISGSVRNNGDVTHSNYAVPTLYLNPTVKFNDIGDGSRDNPYQLLVSKN